MGGQAGGGGNRGGMRGMMYNQQGYGGGPSHLTSLMGQSQQMGYGGGYGQQQQRNMGFNGFNNYMNQYNAPQYQPMAKQIGTGAACC